MPSTNSPWTSPDQVGWCAISAVHWVKASTMTRSKKSSSGVTCSRSRRVAPSLGWRCSGILGVIALEQPLLLVPPREEEVDQAGSEQDRDDAGRVGELVALQKGRLGGGDD